MIAGMLALHSGAASAQVVFSEFSVGAGFPVKVDTADYTVIAPFDFITPGGGVIQQGDILSGSLSGSYNGGITGGIEAGLRGVGDKRISASVSYDYLQLNLDSVTPSGTVNGAPASETILLDALGLSGADFNNEASLVLGNLRYDFVGPREKFQPFVGIGGGVAMIEDSSAAAAIAATAGVRVPLGLGFYSGVRYRFVKAFGYEDEIGIEYKNVNAHLLSFMLGAEL
jgi:hypothetical protein